MALRATDQFMREYMQALAVFTAELERTDPRDEAVFKPTLRLALEKIGMTATSLAERVGHSKGTISKWINTDAMPSQSTREVVMKWILSQAKQQLEDLETTRKKVAA